MWLAIHFVCWCQGTGFAESSLKLHWWPRQWRHQEGAWGSKCPPVGGSAPPVRRKKWPKSAIFGKFLDFCPLRIAFCPLDAPPKKKKKFWCRHWTKDIVGCSARIRVRVLGLVVYIDIALGFAHARCTVVYISVAFFFLLLFLVSLIRYWQRSIILRLN